MLLLPRRKLIRLAAPAIILPGRSRGQMLRGLTNANPPSGASPAWNLTAVAHVGCAPSSGTSTSAAINTTGANLIVFAASGTSGLTVSGSKSNAWVTTASPQQTDGGAVGTIFAYRINPTVGSGHTFTVNSTFCSGNVQAWATTSGTPSLGTNAPAPNAGGYQSSPATSPSITPGQSGALVLCSLGVHNTAGTPTVSGSFTSLDPQSATGPLGSDMAYLVQASAAAITATWTLSTASEMATIIASFYP
jgi:hypothetical protein